jgi:pimeloyl-ACP methyl ester carboxylesterase
MRTVTGAPSGAAAVASRPRERLEVRSGDGTPLYVEVYGPSEGTTVVLVHGWTGSIELWNRQLRDLSEQFRLVAYDQRGHGRSGIPRAAGYTTDALADDLAAVLQATLRPAERAVLAGHSMGAATIVALAGLHPELVADRVAGVLLASTGVDELVVRGRLVPLPLPLARAARPLTTLLLTSRTSRRRDSWLTRRAVRYATLSRSASIDDVALCTGMTVACAPRTRQGFARTLARLDLSAALPNLAVPAIVLVGTADRLTPVWHARRMAAALPRCLRLVEVPGVGHMTPLQSPAVLAGAVRDLAAAT